MLICLHNQKNIQVMLAHKAPQVKEGGKESLAINQGRRGVCAYRIKMLLENR